MRSTLLLFCFYLSVQVPPLGAASLDGTWGSHRPGPDGNTMDTFFTFHQEGSVLTGKVTMPFGENPIKEGKVEGDHFSFAVEVGDPAKPFRIAWEGTIQGNELHLRSVNPGRPTMEMVAKPADPKEFAAPPKLPLPSLKQLESNKLSRTPPMGWNSWNKFHGQINDKTVREIADAMVRTGMLDSGYLYLNVDDTWQGKRDPQGKIQPNSKFPDMKALADYVHNKGLLFGIYSSPGPKTCAGYEGSYGHEEQDAATYSEWGVDYLKYDWCSAARIYSDSEMQAVYQKMGQALADQPRPIVFGLCSYGRERVWEWGPRVSANLWRTTEDIRDNWNSMSRIGFGQNDLAPWAGPGHWNDPDMLEVGNGGMTDDEYRTHMTLWAILAAPLLAGNDLRNMPPKTLDLLTNKEVIAVDQDPLGKQGARVSQSGDQEVWRKPLDKGALAIALFNRGSEPASFTIKWSDFTQNRPTVRDLWKHDYVKADQDTWETTVPKHGVVLLRLSH